MKTNYDKMTDIAQSAVEAAKSLGRTTAKIWVRDETEVRVYVTEDTGGGNTADLGYLRLFVNGEGQVRMKMEKPEKGGRGSYSADQKADAFYERLKQFRGIVQGPFTPDDKKK